MSVHEFKNGRNDYSNITKPGPGTPSALPIPISEGGTGATTAADAIINLGIPTFLCQLDDVDTGCPPLPTQDCHVLAWDDASQTFVLKPSPESLLTVTTDGTTAGVTQSGSADHIVDIILLSAAAGNLLTLDADGGLFLDCLAVSACVSGDPGNVLTQGADGLFYVPDATESTLTVTTDGNTDGVTQSGSAGHILDILLLSAEPGQVLGLAADGGLILDCAAIMDSFGAENRYDSGDNALSVQNDPCAIRLNVEQAQLSPLTSRVCNSILHGSSAGTGLYSADFYGGQGASQSLNAGVINMITFANDNGLGNWADVPGLVTTLVHGNDTCRRWKGIWLQLGREKSIRVGPGWYVQARVMESLSGSPWSSISGITVDTRRESHAQFQDYQPTFHTQVSGPTIASGNVVTYSMKVQLRVIAVGVGFNQFFATFIEQYLHATPSLDA